MIVLLLRIYESSDSSPLFNSGTASRVQKPFYRPCRSRSDCKELSDMEVCLFVCFFFFFLKNNFEITMFRFYPSLETFILSFKVSDITFAFICFVTIFRSKSTCWVFRCGKLSTMAYLVTCQAISFQGLPL